MLLFTESPVLALIVISGIFAGIKSDTRWLTGLSILLLIFMLYFYRYSPSELYDKDIPDNIVVSPAEGQIVHISDKYGYYYMAIFMHPFNNHTQIYPANGTVIKRHYDKTGEFNVVATLGKSKNNEKKSHWILLKNGNIMKVTQIAGYLPRAITSEDTIDYECKVGEYLGMIKFGSRVDVFIKKTSLNNEKFVLSKKVFLNSHLKIGDVIGSYN